MAFQRIEQLKNELRIKPLLRTNNYEVFVLGPSCLGSNTADLFWAQSVTIPGRALSTKEMRTFGPQRDMPYERLYSGDLDVTFVSQKGENIRSFFEKWMDCIIDPFENTISEDRDNYLGGLEIDVLEDDGSITSQYAVFEVFPKSISPVELSYTSTNEYITFNVSFSFREYEHKSK